MDFLGSGWFGSEHSSDGLSTADGVGGLGRRAGLLHHELDGQDADAHGNDNPKDFLDVGRNSDSKHRQEHKQNAKAPENDYRPNDLLSHDYFSTETAIGDGFITVTGIEPDCRLGPSDSGPACAAAAVAAGGGAVCGYIWE